MKFPVVVEDYLAVLEGRFDPSETLIDFFRKVLIPAMNDAYRDGRAGAPGYMRDPAEVIAAYEALDGPLNDTGKRCVDVCTRCLNAAYAQGQRDAGRVSV